MVYSKAETLPQSAPDLRPFVILPSVAETKKHQSLKMDLGMANVAV